VLDTASRDERQEVRMFGRIAVVGTKLRKASSPLQCPRGTAPGGGSDVGARAPVTLDLTTSSTLPAAFAAAATFSCHAAMSGRNGAMRKSLFTPSSAARIVSGPSTSNGTGVTVSGLSARTIDAPTDR
jgi:hypothetical protein